MKKTKICLAIILILSLMIQVCAYAENKYIAKSDEADFFDTVASDIVDIYQFDITKDELLSRLITNMINEDPESLDTFLRALFNSLDDYSEFYTAEEYKEMMNYIENVTGGLGIEIIKGEQYPEILNVIEGAAGYKAGLLAGDLIVAVEGEDMFGKNQSYVASKISGNVGESVNITVRRNGKDITYDIVREELALGTVDYVILGGNVGYIYISRFASSTDIEFANALADMDKYGIKNIVLDLRDNPGGYVDSAVNIAKTIVPKGIIATYYTKYNDSKYNYYSNLTQKKYDFAVLINENSASASELLASALQESGAGVLVGVQSFGKSVTQNMFSLYGGKMCKVTTGEYLTRNGLKINNVGLFPDIQSKNDIVLYKNTDAVKMIYAPEYKNGDKGEGVSCIKERMQVIGYSLTNLTDTYTDELMHQIRAYQKSKGLPETGIADLTTQIYLNNDAVDCEVYIDNQLDAACKYFGYEYKMLRKK